MHQRSKRLGQHRRQTTAHQFRRTQQPARDAGRRVGRHEGVHAQQQPHAVLQGHRGVQRFQQHAVHAGAPVNRHRWIESWKRGAGLHRTRDRHMVGARLAEPDRRSRLEVRRDDHQLVRQLAKVVGATLDGVDLLEVATDRFVVEEADRQRIGEPRQRFQHGLIAGPPGELHQGIGQESRQHQTSAAELFVGGREEILRHKRMLARLGLHQRPGELAGRDAVDERRGDERAGAHADVRVQPSQIQSLERFLEGAKGADLVHGALRSAPRERKPNTPALRGTCGPRAHGSLRRLRRWPAPVRA